MHITVSDNLTNIDQHKNIRRSYFKIEVHFFLK